jgi:uncharacterized ion transporter superfamily protein YfcC
MISSLYFLWILPAAAFVIGMQYILDIHEFEFDKWYKFYPMSIIGFFILSFGIVTYKEIFKK